MLELNREKRISSANQLQELLAPFCAKADLQSLVNQEKVYSPQEEAASNVIRFVMLGIIALLTIASIVIAWLKQG